MLSPSISKLRDELIEYLQDMDCVTASEVGFVAGYMDAMHTLQEPEEAESKSNYDLEDKYSSLAMKLRDSLNNIVGGHAWGVSFIPEIDGNMWHGANYVAHYNGVHGFWDINVGDYGNDSYEMDTMDISAMKNIVWSQHQMIVNEKLKQPAKTSQDVLAAERDIVVKNG